MWGKVPRKAGSHLVVSDAPFALRTAGDGNCFHPQGMQDVADGTGSSPVSEDEGFARRTGHKFQQGTAEACGVGVVAVEPLLPVVPFHAQAIHSPDGSGFVAENINVGEDALLVRDGHVQPAKLRMRLQEVGQGADFLHLKGQVTGIHAFPPE